MPDSAPTEHLYRLLFQAFCWIDDSIRNLLKETNGFTVTRTETMLILLVRNGVTRSSDLARILGISRQAIHKAVTKLESANILALEPHPDDRRSKQVVFCASETPIHQSVSQGLEKLDSVLKARIGEDGFQQLMCQLSKDWGPIHDEKVGKS